MKPKIEQQDDDMRPEYNRNDLKNGVRGKYYHQYNQASNVIILEPDVAAAFPNARAVNRALRLLIKTAQQSVLPTPDK